MWISHIEAAKNYPGNIESYCRSKQISKPAFYYWRTKLAKESRPAVLPRFLPVEVTRSHQSAATTLPDPQWLAELIHHLQDGGGR
jgi:hypothetical protein